MYFADPGDEHVVLTAYERRQFELIERQFASDDLRPGAYRADTEAAPAKSLWLAVVILCAGMALLGAIAASSVLGLVGLASAAAAFVMYRRSRR